jgi:shikimate dehydrogenase
MVSTRKLRAAVIGSPIRHSLSPVIQNAAFQAAGIDGWFEAIEVLADSVEPFFRSIRRDPWLGINVTIPHKEAAFRLVDSRSVDAERAGAVNTVVRRGSALEGHNTDITGFLRALTDDAGFDPAGARVVVLGAGGAARACVVALAQAGAADIVVVNRDPERAAQLVASVGAGRVANGAAADDCRRAELLVNATSVGMVGGPAPDALPLPLDWLPKHGVVYDLVYRPMATPLLRAAASASLPTLGGLAMLVFQGAAAFELWTGRPAPIDRMKAAALGAMGEASACSDS